MRASHPSSIDETDINFRKFVDKMKLAEITIKLEETEILKLQKINNIQTTTSHKINIQDSDNNLVKKSPKSLKYMERTIISNENFHSKTCVTISAYTDIVLLNAHKTTRKIK